MNVQQTECHTGISGLSWAAIFGGIFSSLGVGILLSLLGLGLGMALFQADTDTIANLGVGSIVWFIIGGTIAMFVCGWVAGQFANTHCLVRGGMHGFVAWGLSTVLGVILVSNGAGALVSGAGQLIGKTIEVAGQSMAAVAPDAADISKFVGNSQSKTLQTISKQVNGLLKQGQQQVQKGDAQANQALQAVLNPSSETRQDLMKAVSAYLNNDDQANTAQLRQTVIDQLVKNTDMTQDQALQVVNKWQSTYQEVTEQAQQKVQQAKQKAQDLAEKASSVLSGVAFSAFLTLLIGAIAAIVGGAMATAVRRKHAHHMHVHAG